MATEDHFLRQTLGANKAASGKIVLGGGGTGWESLFCHVFARPPMEVAASLRIFFPPCKWRLPISWLIPQRFMDYVPHPWLYL